MSAIRSKRAAARVSWALLPYIGFHCDKESGTWRWWMRPAYWLWRLVQHLPGADLFEPMKRVVCGCDYCRGVPGARLEP